MQQKQVEAADAQMEMAESQRQAAEEREEERRRERRRQKAAALNLFPDRVETLLAAATTDDRLIGAIAEIAQECAAIDERAWLLLAKITPLQAETTYARLRNLLVPRLPEWWRRRDRLGPSPIPLLKAITKSLRYTSFSSISSVKANTDAALGSAQAELAGVTAELERLQGELAERSAARAAADRRVASAEASWREATAATHTPIDRTEIEAELTSFGPSGCAFVTAIVPFVYALTATFNKEGAGQLCCLATSLSFVVLGGVLLRRAIRNRQLSGEALRKKVEQAVREKEKKRNETLAAAELYLNQCRAEQTRAATEEDRLRGQLPALQARVSQLQQRLATIPHEVMRRYTDPALLPILQE